MRRDALLVAAAAIVFATLVPPLADWADRSLAGHMVLHLIDTDLVPPLVLFAVPAWTRPFRAVPAPVALFGALVLIWGIHFSPLFDASLDSAGLGFAVRGLFLLAGTLMWAPVFDVQRLTHVARLGYVFLAMPLTGFLGFALYSARAPLYAHYVRMCGAGALADQRSGGELMWVGGSAVMFAGFMVLAIEYARYESRIAADPTEHTVA